MPRLHCLFLAWLLLILAGCAHPSSPAAPSPAPVPAATATPSVEEEEDQFALGLLQDKAHLYPASAWLANNRDHILWKGDRSLIQSHFHELEQAGVKEIWASAQTYQNKQIAAAFILILPPPGEARKATFRLYNRFWGSLIADRDQLEAVRRRDEGQKYLLYSFE